MELTFLKYQEKRKQANKRFFAFNVELPFFHFFITTTSFFFLQPYRGVIFIHKNRKIIKRIILS